MSNSRLGETTPAERTSSLLRIDSLDVEYQTSQGAIKALRDVTLELNEGEIYGIAGESGSGKSTLALAIIQYLGENGSITGGEVSFNGRPLVGMSKKELRTIRGNRIAHVAQNPDEALNPSIRVGEQIAETIKLHQDASSSDAKERTLDILREVDISDPEYNAQRYPHELSGGMKQRVLLAMALSCNPDLLILDEPTTGLDVTTQRKILSLIDDLIAQFDTSIILITHNLGVVARIADRVGILYAGEMMEKGPLSEVFNDPTNPYTQGLLGSLPTVAQDSKLTPIRGSIPTIYNEPDGCVFADRCELATDECREAPINLESVNRDGCHQTRCIRWETARANPAHKRSADTVSSTSLSAPKPVDSPPEEQTDTPLISATGLNKYFGDDTVLSRFFNSEPPVRAVNDLSLEIEAGETVGLVGESGCGKSTLGRLLLRLYDLSDGQIRFRGKDITNASERDLREFRSEAQIVFQNPDSSLNPRKTVYEIIDRPLELFTDLAKRERMTEVVKMMQQVGLDEKYANRYPHELSGGEKQRVAIARAFAPNPSFVVLDEPVSALDVSVQANILNLLVELKERYDTSYLFISHDLSVVRYIADRVAVMYLGEIVESGPRDVVFEPPHHPYTRSLLSSVPSADPEVQDDPILLEGDVPSARNPPSGCPFNTRCPQKIGDICVTDSPTLEEAGCDGDDHRISCHLEREEMMRDEIQREARSGTD